MRRWPLYTLVLLAAFALLTAFAYAVHGNQSAVWVSGLVVLPLAATIVYVHACADALHTLDTPALRWERIVERGWAIILIDFGISIAQQVAYEAMLLGNDANLAMGALVLFMATMLLYSEPYAAVETNVSQFAVIPLALMRSMMLAWINIPRVCGFFALELALMAAQLVLLPPVKTPPAGYLAGGSAFGAVATVLLAVLFSAAYAATLRQEQELVS